MSLLEQSDVHDALDTRLVDENELVALVLDERPDHRPWCDIDGLRQRWILRALEEYGQEESLESELVTAEELRAVGHKVLELPPELTLFFVCAGFA